VYYSYDIIEKLELIGVKYIFRLKSKLNNKIIDSKFINKNINNRIVNYKVDDSEDDYFLITNLTNTIDELKELYWKRWKVEIHFKESTYVYKLFIFI